MTKVLFVCTGNTCRSPMAEAIYNSICGTGASSAGISVVRESGASENSKNAVLKYGASLNEHKSRQITLEDIEKNDIIITMTEAHKNMLLSVSDKKEIITLAEFAGENEDVSDPFGGDDVLYKKTAEMIYEYIKKGLKRNINVHLAKECDSEFVAKAEKECFSDAWSEKTIRGEIARGRVAVVEINGNLAGYCIFMLAADEGEILRIAVKPSLRGMGIGKELLEKTLDYMSKQDAKAVYLEVREKNLPAIELYKSVGFEENGIRKNYYTDNGENAILFVYIGERL